MGEDIVQICNIRIFPRYWAIRYRRRRMEERKGYESTPSKHLFFYMLRERRVSMLLVNEYRTNIVKLLFNFKIIL
jgi:hypothetical protein